MFIVVKNTEHWYELVDEDNRLIFCSLHFAGALTDDEEFQLRQIAEKLETILT